MAVPLQQTSCKLAILAGCARKRVTRGLLDDVPMRRRGGRRGTGGLLSLCEGCRVPFIDPSTPGARSVFSAFVLIPVRDSPRRMHGARTKDGQFSEVVPRGLQSGRVGSKMERSKKRRDRENVLGSRESVSWESDDASADRNVRDLGHGGELNDFCGW